MFLVKSHAVDQDEPQLRLDQLTFLQLIVNLSLPDAHVRKFPF